MSEALHGSDSSMFLEGSYRPARLYESNCGRHLLLVSLVHQPQLHSKQFIQMLMAQIQGQQSCE